MRVPVVCAALAFVVLAAPAASGRSIASGLDPAAAIDDAPSVPVGSPVPAGVSPIPTADAPTGLPATDGCRWDGPGSETTDPFYGELRDRLDDADGDWERVWGSLDRRLPGHWDGPVDPPDPSRIDPDCPLPGDAGSETDAPTVPSLDSIRPSIADGRSSALADPVAKRPGYRASMSDSVGGPSPGRDAPVWLLLVFVGGMVAALGAVALYRRLQRDEVLDHDLRGRVLGLVEDRPGITAARVADAFDIHYETARHHLDVLVDFDLVIRTRVAGRVHHFENGGAWSHRDRDRIARIRRGPRPRILTALIQEGTVPAGELAKRLGLSASTMSYHLDRLESVGVIDRSRDGRRRLCDLSEEGARLARAVGD